MNAPFAAVAPPATASLWFKDAIIYQVHVRSFFDANNDGVGDFPGLMAKLDYIADLGVNTVWLLPFYSSPGLDDGYDISEYREVHPQYGAISDVKRFIAAAHERGIRVITELVVNHTSDQHPWFQRARRARPGSNLRNFYVWSDSDQRYGGTRIIFLDTERSNWTWDPVAGAYYWHRFYSHQPDLNYDNPRVLKAVLGAMRFWLELGVDGLRLDAVPYLVEREGTNNENLPETHAILKRIRAEVDAAYPGRMLLAEANQWPEDTKDYFGDGDECHMAFHFPLMPRMYMALAREDRFPITDIMRQTPPIPDNCQWAIFLRNHDELTLEMVTNSERDYLWESYAADRRARLNLGIRRRLAPLLERDRRRIELMNCLLLSMPGAPIIYYGDEIGMGDNIHLGDRHGVRTPMQWSPDRNGGFSRADPATLVLPPIMDPLYGFEAVNVEAQSRDPHSLLNWTRRMLAVRRQHPAFGRGALRFLYPKNRKVLAYLREYQGETILCVANVSRAAQAVELDLSEYDGMVLKELSGGSLFPPIGQLTYLLTLPPYGFYWFTLTDEMAPMWHTPAPEPMPEYVTIVFRSTLAEALASGARQSVEREALPAYLAKRRWFAQKDKKLHDARIAYCSRLPGADREILLCEIETRTNAGASRWLLPLSMVWEEESYPALPAQLALANVRKGGRVGLLTDAFALPQFARIVLELIAAGRSIDTPEGVICFASVAGQADALALPGNAEVIWLSAEQSNSSLIVGEAAMLKIFRRVAGGIHPEVEMVRHLTESGYSHVPAMVGEAVRIGPDGTPHSLAIVQRFVRNQGDAWTWTLDNLARAIDDLSAQTPDTRTLADRIADLDAFAAIIGRRLGEMHAVLAKSVSAEAFAPAVAQDRDVASWIERAQGSLETAWIALGGASAWPNERDAKRVQRLLAHRDDLGRALRRLAHSGQGSLMTRIHGDFHLGQVLVVSGDAYLIDFEGEPSRSVDERRSKASPLRDVAGLLRSFDYAAATLHDRLSLGTAHAAPGQDELLEVYRQRSGEAFLNAYRQTVGAAGEDRNSDLLHFFLIEKAAYEIAYESANRPTWLSTPMNGLWRLARDVLGWTNEDGDG